MPRTQNGHTFRPAAPAQRQSPGSVPQKNSPVNREAVAKRAYEKFLKRGGSHGSDVNDWLEAEKEIRNESRKN